MAIRVTGEEVKEIFETSLTATQLQPFIVAANQVVEAKLGDNTDLSSDEKKELERWLTAHIASARDQRVASETLGDGSSVKYQGATGLGLDSTTYGQMVKLLDTTGTLSKLGAKKAGFTSEFLSLR